VSEPVSVSEPHVRDAQGKRALFSSTEQLTRPAAGGITIECSRCGETTALSPLAALRAAFPALHLSVRVRLGERDARIGVLRGRRYGSLLRCPACGRPAWVRVTFRA
jgi:predicted RNA-binding Zn-ribbon protein involved in translation (DUF1610 family)